jgi:glycosyltransferase involved in cell wall biosynthesis
MISDRLPSTRLYKHSPIIQLDDWTQLEPTVKALLLDRNRLADLQKKTIAWWTRCVQSAPSRHSSAIRCPRNDLQGIIARPTVPQALSSLRSLVPVGCSCSSSDWCAPSMKLLLLSMEYSPGLSGGVGTHVQELSTGLAATGDSVTVLSGTVGKHERTREGNKFVHLVPPGNDRPRSASIAQGILGYNRTLVEYAKEALLTRDRPDLIHCHNWITFPAAREIASITGAPLLTTVHYLSDPIEQWWGQTSDPEIVAQEREMLSHGMRFIAVSAAIRALMNDVYEVPKNQINVIYNGIDPALFQMGAREKSYGERLKKIVAPANESIVLYTGRLHPMKGVTALLKSAAIVLDEHPATRYVLAGDPDSQAFALEFRAQLEGDSRLKNGVTVLGKINRRQVAALYSVADLAILPSVFDPCPYAAIEAMFAGIPLIASNGGGLAELLLDQVSGISIPVRHQHGNIRSVDPAELAHATLRVLRDKDFAQKIGQNARDHAYRAYTSATMVKATRQLYAEIVNSPNRQNLN